MEIEPSTGYNELSSDNNNKTRNKPKWRFGRKQSDSSLGGRYNSLNDERFQEEEEIYIVKQRWGYCSIIFSIAQTIILAIMMIQCGVAPLNINPMVVSPLCKC